MRRRYRNLGIPIAGLLFLFGGWNCNFGNEGFFSIGNLTVVPNPAQQGDVVTFVFNLTVVPEKSFTVTAFVDDSSHASENFRQLQEGAFEFIVGDAVDLINEYGLGEHIAGIQVRLNESGDVISARSAVFVLQDAE